MPQPIVGLPGINALDDAELDALLSGVCDSAAWTALVRSTRPWSDGAALHAANAAATAALTPADLDDALAGHARIGRLGTGDSAAAREQSGVREADRALLDELESANSAYEAKFGHVFLVCATGRTAASMLADLRTRYGNDAASERETLRGELRKINDLRLDRLLHTTSDGVS